MIRRPPRSTHCISSAASDVYKRQIQYDWHAQKCKAGKTKRNDSEDSNIAEYEGIDKVPHRNMSRRIEIQNLALMNYLETITSHKSVTDDEEMKVPDKSKTVSVKPEKKGIPATLKPSTQKSINKMHGQVLQNDIHGMNINESEKQGNHAKKRLKPRKTDESLCDFQEGSITERIQGSFHKHHRRLYSNRARLRRPRQTAQEQLHEDFPLHHEEGKADVYRRNK
eukprot:TRINITY_DN4384_c0_g1_i6.p1 TRINITY_DN4384_c0_g1~~TRINITY_DN4384_c0_g1_i6.p1  ORF type:complete len:232 (+),score=40.58 TRINITY_DN4384_c0_g1_i6:25-696(+)